MVGMVWLVFRDGDGEVLADGSATTSEGTSDTSTPSGEEGEASDTTDDAGATSEETTTETTTIGDVPLSDLPSGAPDSFVAVTSETFELVRVDSRSGEILQELGSWTPDLAEGAEPDQALQMVELAPGGTIYVDDCCEPAYGSTFIVTDAFDPAATPRLDGVDAEISPDGSRLARSSQGSAVTISDADGNELGTFGDADFTGPVTTALTWVDSSTLVVDEAGDDTIHRLQILDVGDPNAPVLLAERAADPGFIYLAADVRADGNILVVRRTGAAGDVIAEIIDPATGATITDFDLPDDVYEANYDATGRFVVTVGTAGQLDWYGAGQRGTLGTGFISVDW